MPTLIRAADTLDEALETARALSAIARQLRVLASNTSIEAARLPTAGALGEIAHRMRLLSEQASTLNATLLNVLQLQAHAVEELREGLRRAEPDAAAASSLEEPSTPAGWAP
jgi:hypothetical protein